MTARPQVELPELPIAFDRLPCEPYDDMIDVFTPAQMHAYARQAIAESEARAEDARDAARWRAMREIMVAIDFDPEMGGGPVVMFACHAERICAGPEGADAVADAAIAQEAKRDAASA